MREESFKDRWKRRIKHSFRWAFTDSVVRTVLIVAVIPGFALNIAVLDSVVTAQVKGCERSQPTKVTLDAVQKGLTEFLATAETARQSSAESEIKTDPEQAVIDFKAAEDYQTIQDDLAVAFDDLVDANAEFAVEDESVVVNCEDAYPRPFPLVLLP